MDNKLTSFFVILLSLLMANTFFCDAVDSKDLRIIDIDIYKNTPAWELALAVRDQRTQSIEAIAKENPALVNYQEPKYGATLLLWAVGMEKFDSAETLLKCGADPDIASTYDGTTPLFEAAGYSWIDNDAKKDPKYVILLLRYRANPNKTYIGFHTNGVQSVIETGTSPLMNSIPCGIEKTKALVEAGADINCKTKWGDTAAIDSLGSKEYPEYAYYLIVEKNAKVSEPYYSRFSYSDPTKQFFPVDILRNWVFDLGSKEYKIKMEIVNEFARQGVNYWDTKINKFTLQQIKKLYPDTWEEYVKKY